MSPYRDIFFHASYKQIRIMIVYTSYTHVLYILSYEWRDCFAHLLIILSINHFAKIYNVFLPFILLLQIIFCIISIQFFFSFKYSIILIIMLIPCYFLILFIFLFFVFYRRKKKGNSGLYLFSRGFKRDMLELLA